MSTFEVKVYKLKIEEHPNADALELAVVGDYRAVVGKGQFQTGDLGVYIPEAAVLPDWLIEQMGLTGRLAGKAKNRVKAIKLRGIFSQGLVYPLMLHPDYETVWCLRDDNCQQGRGQLVELGDDLQQQLGITKYEPVIPTCMNGEVIPAFGCTLKYDIENIKKFPHILEYEEPVVITEKIHGTWCCFGWHPDVGDIVTSKGLSDKGLIFDLDAEANKNNLYVRALESTTDENGLDVIQRALASNHIPGGTPFYILGEVFGKGVQDLTYGQSGVQFRVFDIYIGGPGQGHYVDDESKSGPIKQDIIDDLGVTRVPVLSIGPYLPQLLDLHTTGKENVSGKEANICEGVVIVPMINRYHPEIGRVILKSVSEDYLLRKNATEYN